MNDTRLYQLVHVSSVHNQLPFNGNIDYQVFLIISIRISPTDQLGFFNGYQKPHNSQEFVSFPYSLERAITNFVTTQQPETGALRNCQFKMQSSDKLQCN